ncbi:MAG: MarR family transcriptional regulator [Stappiaceae bacterium]
MTEIKEETEMTDKLPNAVEGFILQWGDLGGKWGVNRSIGQIHAFLYLATRPLTAEDIAERLGMARSNVSNSIKELLSWNLIRRVPQMNDRREHFEAETDVWEIAARIAAGRKAREIDPALSALQNCVGEAKDDPTVSDETRQRLQNMLEFTASVDNWYSQMLAMPQSKRQMILKLGSKIVSFLPGGKDKD